MIHLLAIVLSLVGFAALALAMKRHQREVIGRALTDKERHLTRSAGALAIAASLAVAMAAFGAGYGAVAWFGYMSVAAWIVVAALCWHARLKS
ncbi:DUF3325 domain-containing protein [Aurantiacibacter xanthus]|uniref:DUF3325 domain-containing protein n=1 Tax=Aurantiacibacter xanthus TaxID=1784712 RepID=A0A3A1P4L8_9SPHN|nr:DUF3325 domain-containing protein [Aurantiacibacter xanthus]RIV80920.1 DUF3325 domain-containing protein [Aurantiacibacter xanthus]